MKEAKIIGFNADVVRDQQEAKRLRQRQKSIEDNTKHIKTRLTDEYKTSPFDALKGYVGKS